MNQVVDTIFQILIVIFSVVVHEVSHGAMAYALGDNTAKDAGRLTLNPIPHIDMVGSILMPILIGFGWAKPVPYNPYNLKDQKWGPFLVGIAGPASNILVAIVFGLVLRFSEFLTILGPAILSAIFPIVIINLGLAVFNLIPVPPLDGSKILYLFWPKDRIDLYAKFEQYGFFILLILILLFRNALSNIIFPIIGFFFRLITGSTF